MLQNYFPKGLIYLPDLNPPLRLDELRRNDDERPKPPLRVLLLLCAWKLFCDDEGFFNGALTRVADLPALGDLTFEFIEDELLLLKLLPEV